MKWIVITSPAFLPGEARLIRCLFDHGLDVLHLRKPGSALADCRRLIEDLPPECYSRIVVHDHFSLCRDYGLMGVHLNSRHPLPPSDFDPRSVSASCHGLEEVKNHKDALDYVFLSPVFDSISKEGYHSAYGAEQLRTAAAAGIIDDKVVALGGVTASSIPQLREWRFGGAAFLGDVWNRAGQSGFDNYLCGIGESLHRQV